MSAIVVGNAPRRNLNQSSRIADTRLALGEALRNKQGALMFAGWKTTEVTAGSREVRGR